MQKAHVVHKRRFCVALVRILSQMVQEMSPTRLTRIILSTKYLNHYQRVKNRFVFAWNSSLKVSGMFPDTMCRNCQLFFPTYCLVIWCVEFTSSYFWSLSEDYVLFVFQNGGIQQFVSFLKRVDLSSESSWRMKRTRMMVKKNIRVGTNARWYLFIRLLL